jgi:hypothetical protein
MAHRVRVFDSLEKLERVYDKRFAAKLFAASNGKPIVMRCIICEESRVEAIYRMKKRLARDDRRIAKLEK